MSRRLQRFLVSYVINSDSSPRWLLDKHFLFSKLFPCISLINTWHTIWESRAKPSKLLALWSLVLGPNLGLAEGGWVLFFFPFKLP